ncbi:aminotransferase class I/II-fold pyridoxal phosphate-dependent enzyme [Candidatus Dojkabacteria bacterium]|nr:aminotransferase class I/II-fold pyridoxal phosphate-dependent enzyme [Candidatus Dojkabacteria bacterium]
MTKPIFIAASPNTQKDDVCLAFKQLLWPFGWYSKKPVKEFEGAVQDYLGLKNAIAVDSARSAFYLTLKALGIGFGDEVLLPSFTCVVIVNPVLWVGAKPVFVDINRKNFNIDFSDLEKKVTPKTKAILVQHTFGIPVEMEKVTAFAKKHNLKIIEDLAHSIGGKYKGKTLGTFGDASVLTFGIEKVISTVRGGMVVTNDRNLAQKLREKVSSCPRMGLYRTFTSLFNPVFWVITKPLYYLGIKKITLGRFFIAISRLMNATGQMIEKEEYAGQKPGFIPSKMPGTLAKLGLNQMKKLEKYNKHRKQIGNLYFEKLSKIASSEIIYYYPKKMSECSLLRYPILVKNPDLIHAKAKKNRIILGNWYERMFHIPVENLELIGYKKETAKNAEWVARHIINLPIYWAINEKSVIAISQIICGKTAA